MKPLPFVFVLVFCNKFRESSGINEEPIIGVLAQETLRRFNKAYSGQYKSFIAASYVKFNEGGGARVIPIWINKPKKYYIDIMSKINGLFFPGGAAKLTVKGGYAEAGMFIFQRAKELNDAGDYFPLWGTCLGFELLAYLDADRHNLLERCNSNNRSLPLEFSHGFRSSKLFHDTPDEVINALRSYSITSNFHKYCVTEEGLESTKITQNWKITSTNHDVDGLKFISSMEHKKYPFYGVQFHPEKNIYEWLGDHNVSHSKEAIHANQYFAEFFVNEAKKNYHKFPGGLEDEQKHLIYNYPATYTRLKKLDYEQAYLFAEGIDFRLQENQFT